MKRNLPCVLLIAIVAFVLNVHFNGCAPAKFSRAKSGAVAEQNTSDEGAPTLQGDGHVYTGKSYYLFDRSCENKDKVRAEIRHYARADQSYLVKRDCNEITPLALDKKEVQIDTENDVLLFEGETYQASSDADEDFAKSATVATCSYYSPRLGMSRYIYLKPGEIFYGQCEGSVQGDGGCANKGEISRHVVHCLPDGSVRSYEQACYLDSGTSNCSGSNGGRFEYENDGV